MALLSITGCITFGDKPNKVEWNYPDKPITEKIDLEKTDNGYFITNEDAEKLAKSLEELRAYIAKLEALLEKMEEHYDK